MLLLVISGWLSIWLTPVWMVGVGVLAAFAVLLVLWGLFALVSPARAAEVPEMLSEGALLPITWVLGLLALFGVLGTFVAKDVRPILSSATRFASTGQRDYLVHAEPAPDDTTTAAPVRVPSQFVGRELRSISVESPVDVTLESVAQLAGKPVRARASGTTSALPGG